MAGRGLQADSQKAVTGDIWAAEAHLDGLMTLLDSGNVDEVSQDTTSVLQRYIMICIQEVLRLRRHVSKPPHAGISPTREKVDYNDELSRGVVEPMADFSDRLRALWLMPYLYLASQDLRAEDIDATGFIHTLRSITSKYCGCRPSRIGQAATSYSETGSSGSYVTSFFMAGLSESGQGPRSYSNASERFRCPWIGFSITMGFYLYGLVGLGAPGDLIDGRSLRWLTRVLQRDIEKGVERGMNCDRGGPFWLWKVVMGAFAIVSTWEATVATGGPEKSIFGSEAVYLELKAWFCAKLRLWSENTGIIEWEDARDVLASIVWPQQADGEQLVVMIWEDALAEGRGALY